LKTSQELIVVL